MNLRLNFRGLAPAMAASMLLLGGCAIGPDVRFDYDRTADFSQYKTFAFASPLGTDRGGYQAIVSTHLKAATRREMETRGMRYDPSAPQLLVNFNATLNEKLRVTTSSMPTVAMGFGRSSGYYGYRGGLYSPWPQYRDETVVTPHQEGTLNIDIADAARKQLVWEGIVSGTVSEKALDNLQLAIDTAVAAAFTRYPLAGPAKAK